MNYHASATNIGFLLNKVTVELVCIMQSMPPSTVEKGKRSQKGADAQVPP
jgi:hypothetical protein